MSYRFTSQTGDSDTILPPMECGFCDVSAPEQLVTGPAISCCIGCINNFVALVVQEPTESTTNEEERFCFTCRAYAPDAVFIKGTMVLCNTCLICTWAQLDHPLRKSPPSVPSFARFYKGPMGDPAAPETLPKQFDIIRDLDARLVFTMERWNDARRHFFAALTRCSPDQLKEIYCWNEELSTFEDRDHVRHLNTIDRLFDLCRWMDAENIDVLDRRLLPALHSLWVDKLATEDTWALEPLHEWLLELRLLYEPTAKETLVALFHSIDHSLPWQLTNAGDRLELLRSNFVPSVKVPRFVDFAEQKGWVASKEYLLVTSRENWVCIFDPLEMSHSTAWYTNEAEAKATVACSLCKSPAAELLQVRSHRICARCLSLFPLESEVSNAGDCVFCDSSVEGRSLQKNGVVLCSECFVCTACVFKFELPEVLGMSKSFVWDEEDEVHLRISAMLKWIDWWYTVHCQDARLDLKVLRTFRDGLSPDSNQCDSKELLKPLRQLRLAMEPQEQHITILLRAWEFEILNVHMPDSDEAIEALFILTAHCLPAQHEQTRLRIEMLEESLLRSLPW